MNGDKNDYQVIAAEKKQKATSRRLYGQAKAASLLTRATLSGTSHQIQSQNNLLLIQYFIWNGKEFYNFMKFLLTATNKRGLKNKTSGKVPLAPPYIFSSEKNIATTNS